MHLIRLGAANGLARKQVAPAFMQQQVKPEERLQATAEARFRLAGALRDRPDPAAVARVEVEDAVRLAVADAAQDDRLGLDRSSRHESSFTGRVGRYLRRRRGRRRSFTWHSGQK